MAQYYCCHIAITSVLLLISVLTPQLVQAESMFTPRLFEIAKFIPEIDLPSWFNYGVGGKLEPGQRVGPIDPIHIIKVNGYPAERHLVETEDGYILELHRIPRKNGTSNTNSQFPVLLLHGNFQSSADWLINNSVNNSFGFLLWNHGFDVWLGNHRGGTYAKRHKRYPPNSNEFWDYSIHEMGVYDVPAMIDYVLTHTAKEKLHYLCFSYSSAGLMAGLSSRPEYNAKIASAVIMGASVFQSNNLNGLLHYIAYPSRILEPIFNLFGTFPIVPPILAQILGSIVPAFCKLDKIGICVNVMHLMVGHDGDLIKADQMPLITSVVPSATGMKQLYHLFQMARHHQFAQYDYGPQRNMELYGRETPPPYNLSQVTAPISIYGGRYDYLSSQKDAIFLSKKLPNLVEYYEIPYEMFSHIDFTYGGEIAVEQVYMRIVEKLKAFPNR